MTTPAEAPADPTRFPAVPDRLPAAAWALAASSVLVQGLTFAERGMKSDGDWAVVVSMLIGAVVVRWFAAGVLSARTGRLVVVWLLLAVAFVAETAAVLDDAGRGQIGMPALQLLSTVAMVGSLMWFSTTPYYFWQRTRPRVSGPSRAGVLAVAVVVGLSAGLVETDAEGPGHVQVGDGG